MEGFVRGRTVESEGEVRRGETRYIFNVSAYLHAHPFIIYLLHPLFFIVDFVSRISLLAPKERVSGLGGGEAEPNAPIVSKAKTTMTAVNSQGQYTTKSVVCGIRPVSI